jgi:hypothetical protein
MTVAGTVAGTTMIETERELSGVTIIIGTINDQESGPGIRGHFFLWQR